MYNDTRTNKWYDILLFEALSGYKKENLRIRG